MMNYSEMMAGFEQSKSADHDNREKVREAQLFINSRDGQWESTWWNANVGKPRYKRNHCDNQCNLRQHRPPPQPTFGPLRH